MIALTSPYLWYISRATGLVTLVLFTFVIVLGTLVSNRVGGRRVGRFEVNELHRSLSLIAMVFLAIHVLTTVLDTYVATGLLSSIVPFVSRYDRFGVAVGTVSIDLMLAVWISSLAKSRVRPQSWRYIHWLSWLAFISAILHTFLIGSDARVSWGLALCSACAAVVAAAVLWRAFARPQRARGRTALSPLDAPNTDAVGARGQR
ncbi:MAG TPA: ferric reductase-like transmembrane domain-containing protein [Acidimicrobiales bacterium]